MDGEAHRYSAVGPDLVDEGQDRAAPAGVNPEDRDGATARVHDQKELVVSREDERALVGEARAGAEAMGRERPGRDEGATGTDPVGDHVVARRGVRHREHRTSGPGGRQRGRRIRRLGDRGGRYQEEEHGRRRDPPKGAGSLHGDPPSRRSCHMGRPFFMTSRTPLRPQSRPNRAPLPRALEVTRRDRPVPRAESRRRSGRLRAGSATPTSRRSWSLRPGRSGRVGV